MALVIYLAILYHPFLGWWSDVTSNVWVSKGHELNHLVCKRTLLHTPVSHTPWIPFHPQMIPEFRNINYWGWGSFWYVPFGVCWKILRITWYILYPLKKWWLESSKPFLLKCFPFSGDILSFRQVSYGFVPFHWKKTSRPFCKDH